MPGIEVRRLAASSARICSVRSSFKASIRLSSDRHSSRMSAMSITIRLERSEGGSARKGSISRSRTLRPCRKVCPRSSRIARSWFTSALRAATRRERARCRVCRSSRSWLFNSTKRMVGRVAASAIPAASLSSFFCAHTYGRTYVWADILRRHQPDVMPFRGEETTDMMSAAARLHGDGAGWKPACELGKRRPPHASAQNDLPLRVQAHHAVQVLAQVDPKGHDGHRSAPSSQARRHHSLEPAGGAGHPIKDVARQRTGPARRRTPTRTMAEVSRADRSVPPGLHR